MYSTTTIYKCSDLHETYTVFPVAVLHLSDIYTETIRAVIFRVVFPETTLHTNP